MTIRTIAGISLAFFALGAFAQWPAKAGFARTEAKALQVQSSPIIQDRTIGTRALSDVNEAFKVTAGSGFGAADDRLGRAVSYSSDSIAIGAPTDDSGALVDAGSVYVYVRSGSVWTRQQKIDPPVPEQNAAFGSSVAISGNTLVVGSPFASTSDGSASGAVYVYTRTGSTWSLQQALDPATRTTNDKFGSSVDVEGDSLIAGARTGDVTTNGAQGTAYVFTRTGSVWTEQQRLTAADGATADNFGNSVALSGNTAIVGANLAFVSALEAAGAAYVYVRNAGVWTQQQKLVAPVAGDLDEFGVDVDVEGETAIVGHRNEDSAAINTGAARVYTRSGSVWSLQATLTAADAAANDFLGLTVALSGNFALVGAYTDDRTGLLNAGAAYLFERSNLNVWSQKDKYIASDAANDDQFGFEVAIGPGFGIVGAPLDDNSDGIDAGATYVFSNGTPTTTVLGATSNSLTYGDNLTLTAVVSPAATGTVNFLNNGSSIGSSVLNGLSQASLILLPTPGSYNYSANYLGDGNNLASSSNTQAVTVAKAATSLMVNVSSTSVVYGENVTISTTLTDAAVGGVSPTGSIVFTDNGNFLASVPLSGGQANLTRNNLPVGSHDIVASYAGDANFLGTSAGAVNIQTTIATVSINVASTPNPAARNTNQTFSATFTGGIPTGNVAFQALPLPSGSPIALGSPLINSGVATVVSSVLPVGSYTIRVIYVGDSNHNFAIADTAQPHVVTPSADLSIVKTNNQNYVTEGEQVTYTITVSNPANGDPVTGALINDNVNGGFFDDSAAETTWTCTPTGNADCAASAGTGDISGLAVDLDPGTSVTIVLTTRCRAEGNEFLVSNTATVSAPGGLTDSNLLNNTSTDADQSGLFLDGFE